MHTDWFFKKTNNIDQLLVKPIKKKARGRRQKWLIPRKEKKASRCILQTLKILRGYYKQPYENKYENLDKINECLEKDIRTYARIENLNRHTHIKEMKSILQNLSTKRTPGTDDLIGEFHKLFKKDMKTILHKLFLEKILPVFLRSK